MLTVWCTTNDNNIFYFFSFKFFQSRITIELPTMEAISRNIQKLQPSDDSSDGGHHSDFSFNISNSNEPTPFSSKHVWRESDTPHAKTTDDGSSKSNNIADDEKLLIPGDISEMNKFCDETETTSKLKIIVNLPIVSLQLRYCTDEMKSDEMHFFSAEISKFTVFPSIFPDRSICMRSSIIELYRIFFCGFRAHQII